MKKYNTLIRINRSIRFWGLSSMQFTVIVLFGAITVVVLVFKRVHPFVLVVTILGLIMGFVFLFAKLKEQQKKGNPNYLQGYFIKGSTPRKILDKGFYFKNILK